MLFCRFRHFYTQIAACTRASCSARARSACVLLSPAPPARTARAASLYSFATRPSAFRESISRRTSRTAASQPSPRTQRLRFAFARLATRAQLFHARRISLQFWHSSFRLSREHFPHRSLSTLPAHAALAFYFRPPRHPRASDFLQSSARRSHSLASCAAAPLSNPAALAAHTPPSVNISRAFSQNRAIPRQNARHAARILRIAPPRGIPRCISPSRAISRHDPPARCFSRPHSLRFPFSTQKARRISISRGRKQRVFAMPRHFFACLPPGRSTLPATNHRRAKKSLRLSQIMPK